MSRLPTIGGDDNTWGNVLNDFLSVEHNPDGTLKDVARPSDLIPKADDTTVVHNSGSETVAGVKTFSSSPAVPTPTNSADAANKSYVDGVTTAGAPDSTTSSKGIVQLAGDLGGTAASPTVPGLANKVSSVTPADGTITIGGTSSSPTVGVNAIPESSVTNLTTDLNTKLDKSTVTAKGDLLAATAASSISRLGVGSDGQVLTADSTQTAGVKWGSGATGASTTSSNTWTADQYFKSGDPWVDVKAYGALGDGTTDDTAAIQSAINTAGNQSIIFFPKGSYLVTDQGSGFCLDISSRSGITFLSLSYSRANPSSVGGGATIFTTSAGTKIIKSEAAALNHLGPRFQGMRIEDRGGNSTCVSLKLYNNYTFRDCTFQGAGGSTTGVGIKLDGTGGDASYGYFENCGIHKNAVGILGAGSCGFAVVGGYMSSNVANHSLITAVSSSITIFGVKFECGITAGASAILVPGGAGIEITACNFEGCTTGVNLQDVGSATYYATSINGCSFTGTNGSETAIYVGTNRVSDHIIGCRFSNLSASVTDNGTGTVIVGTRIDAARVYEYIRLGGVSICSGSGAPGGVVAAPVGSLYLRNDGSASTTIYIKQTGTGNSGWTALGAGGNSSWARNTYVQSGGGTLAVDVTNLSLIRISVTDTNAFTIGPPTSSAPGQIVFFEIFNNSGGTLGNVTWSTASGGFSTGWSNTSSKPANGHHSVLSFCYDDALNEWVQAGATVDLP